MAFSNPPVASVSMNMEEQHLSQLFAAAEFILGQQTLGVFSLYVKQAGLTWFKICSFGTGL